MKNPFHRTANAAGATSADTSHLDPSDPPTAQLGPVLSGLALETASPEDLSPEGHAPTDLTPEDPAPVSARRRWPLVAGATAVVLLGTGAVAYGSARKTIELDVDGTVTQVTTFAGSVEGLLEEQGVSVGDRDLVVPAADSALRGGADVVVRYGRQVTVQVDGAQSNLWLTDLDADEALTTLASRGENVRLVASRSGAEGRPSLPLRLDANEPVNLVVDGATTVVPNGSQGVDALLDKSGVVLGELDRVSVQRDEAADPAVSLVVQRVKVEEVPTTVPVPFETVTEEDATRYKDLGPVVKQEGVEGVHTTVNRVTTVDSVEESRELVSDGVTTAPVSKIVVQGTKERPKPAPRPAASTPAPSGSAPAPAASAVSGDVWAALAQCESGGRVNAVSANGKYHGLYQFSVGTWQAMGGSGLPSQASAAEQTQRAQALQARSGWGQWPACSRKLGLR